MRDQMLAKLRELEDMLDKATIDGTRLVETDCYREVAEKISDLTQSVEYYID